MDDLYKLERRTDSGTTLNDRLITEGYAQCKTWATGMLAALIFGISVASADMPAGNHLEAIISQPRLDLSSAAPKVLSSNDVDRYRDIFRIQKDGHWPEANALIARLENPILLGHVLAQRFLHPTKYRSRYKELKDWMAAYADHPDAARLYKLALRRKPKTGTVRKYRHAPGCRRRPRKRRPARSRAASLAAPTDPRCATTNVISIGCFGAATPLRQNEPFSLET